jgi:hypothetical protein
VKKGLDFKKVKGDIILNHAGDFSAYTMTDSGIFLNYCMVQYCNLEKYIKLMPVALIYIRKLG